MSGSDDTVMLAGEYVLGVLDHDQMRVVAGRALSDAALDADIAAWERQLNPLAMLVPPLEPPAALWSRLTHSLDGLILAAHAASPHAAALRQVRLWRSATVAALVVAAGFAIAALLPPGTPPQALTTVAALAPLSGPATAFIVHSLPDGRLQIAALSPAAVPSGRDLELWALPFGTARPVSLGVLPIDGTTIKASDLITAGSKLLVSLEPKGGSATGQPTGKVLYGGTVSQL